MKMKHSTEYREMKYWTEHLKICRLCGDKLPKKQRSDHIRLTHKMPRIKKKAWRMFY